MPALSVDDGAAGMDSLAFWWNAFRDPVLSRLIESGFESAPTVEAAVARLRAARALREGAEAAHLPQFTAGGDYTWSRRQGGGIRSGWEDGLGAHVSARWEADLFGGVRRSVEKAEAEEARLAYTLQEVRVSLAADIAAAYTDVRRCQARLAIANRNLQVQERSAELTRKRVEADSATRYDLTTAEAQVARTQASIPTLEHQLVAAELKLDWLSGRVPFSSHDLLNNTGDTMFLPDQMPSNALPNALLRRRADIRAAEAAVRGQTAAIGIAEADIYPKFFLSGMIGVSSPDLAPLSAYTRSASFGPSFSWNIFGFGTWRRRIESAKAHLDASVADYRKTVLTAYRETAEALDAYRRELNRTNALFEAREKTAQSLAIARKIFEAGESDIREVLTQQRSLLTAEEAIADHRAGVFSNAIRLYRTLGGGWSDEPRPEDGGGAPDGREP